MEHARKGMAGKLLALATALLLVITMSFESTPAQALNTGGLTEPGSITVHKYKTQTVSNIPGTGEESQSLPYGAEPMSGVTFTLYQLDTAKVEGAVPGTSAATAAPSADDVAAFLLTYRDISAGPVVEVTDTEGEASFENLDFAYYLLVETDSGSANVDMAAPSIVTVPYAQPATGGSSTFIKDVHVYPKNISKEEVEKTVIDQPDSVNPGDSLEYQISFKVPEAGKIYTDASNYMTGTIVDTLPSNAAGQPTITVSDAFTVYALSQNGVSHPLTAADMGYSNTSGTDGKITWTLTSAIAQAVDALNVADPSDPIVKIQIRVTSTVNDNAFNAGVDSNGQPSISNTATVTVNDSEGTAFIADEESSTDPIPTPGFQFAKVDTSGAALTSDSATFKMAATHADASNGVYLRNNGSDLTAITSLTNGLAVFSGLGAPTITVGNTATVYTAITDAVTAAEANVGVPQTVEVWLVETESPDGYRLLQAPQRVTLEIEKATADAMITTTVVDGPLSIVNTLNGEEGGGNFALPNTGGAGAIIFIVIGVVLVGVATGYFVRTRKRNERSGRS